METMTISEKSERITTWSTQKVEINRRADPSFFKTGQVWWCALGANIGAEEDGKNELFERPVLVLRKFNRELFFGVPLTTNARQSKFLYGVPARNGQSGQAMLTQSRVLSAKRLLRIMYEMPGFHLARINKAIYELMGERPKRVKSKTLTKSISSGFEAEESPLGIPSVDSSVANTREKVKGERRD